MYVSESSNEAKKEKGKAEKGMKQTKRRRLQFTIRCVKTETSGRFQRIKASVYGSLEQGKVGGPFVEGKIT